MSVRKLLVAFARRAASFAFAICSRRALEELETFAGGDSSPFALTSDRRAAFALAIWSLNAAEELVFRPVTGVILATAVSLSGDGVKGSAVAGGDIACPNTPDKEGLVFGVLAVIVLLFESGRSLGVFWLFCI